MAWDFHSLFGQHARGISRALQRRGFDRDVAADLTQDTFLRVIRAAPQDEAPDALMRAYLYKVARNLGINHARREALFRPVSLDAPEALPALAAAPDTETVVASREQLRLVRLILLEMPERQRKAFLLHRMCNWPIARIAEEIGLSTTRTWELIRAAYRDIVLRCGES